jgi:hypothetical protein
MTFSDWKSARIIRFKCGAKIQVLPVISSTDPLSLTGMEKKLFEEGGHYTDLKNGTHAYNAPISDSERVNFRPGKESNRNFFSFTFTLEAGNACNAATATDVKFRYRGSSTGLCQATRMPIVAGQTFLNPMAVIVAPDKLIDTAPGFQDIARYAVGLPIQSNMRWGQVEVTSSYQMSFTLTPQGTVSGRANIIHFSKTNQHCCKPGSQMPAIFFLPGSTQIQVNVGHATDGEWGVRTTRNLPLDQPTSVTVRVTKGTLQLFLNSTLAASATTQQPTVTGVARVYLSSPWSPAANAILGAFSFTKI